MRAVRIELAGIDYRGVYMRNGIRALHAASCC